MQSGHPAGWPDFSLPAGLHMQCVESPLILHSSCCELSCTQQKVPGLKARGPSSAGTLQGKRIFPERFIGRVVNDLDRAFDVCQRIHSVHIVSAEPHEALDVLPALDVSHEAQDLPSSR